MSRHVVVVLSIAEADALSHAAGNTTEYPDAMEAIFQHPPQRKAAYRAHEKLDAAIQAARKKRP